MQIDVKKILGHVPIFSKLSQETVEELAKKASQKQYAKNKFLFREGEESDGLFINLEGVLKVEKNEMLLSYIDHGESVGEIGVLNNWPRSADLKAMDECQVLFIPKYVLEEVLAKKNADTLQIYKNAVLILGKLLKSKNVVLEFSKIFDETMQEEAQNLDDITPVSDE